MAAGPSGMVGLKSGSLGDTVKSLQQALIKAGVSVRGGADGIFGPATAQALKSFQQSQGLNPSGVVDDATLAALQNPKAPVSPTSNGDGGYAVFGEKGTRVIQLQSALVNAGIAVRGGVDGDFGAGTAAAVMDFQRAKGLNVTGKVNEATANALGLGKAEAPPPPQPGSASFSVFPVQGRCGFTDTFGYARGGGRDSPRHRHHRPRRQADLRRRRRQDHQDLRRLSRIARRQRRAAHHRRRHLLLLCPHDRDQHRHRGRRPGQGRTDPRDGRQATGDTNTNHLHFEVHPKGGAAINSYPLLKAIDACNVTDPLPQP